MTKLKTLRAELKELEDKEFKIKEEILNELKKTLNLCPNCKRKTQIGKSRLIIVKTYEDECGYPVHTRTWINQYIECPKCSRRIDVKDQDKRLFKEVVIEEKGD